MKTPLRRGSLALLLGLAGCGDKPNMTGGGESTGASTDTEPPPGGSTTTGVTTGGDSEPTTGSSPGTATTSADATGMMTSNSTTVATTGGETTGAGECQIEPPAPGRCDGGAPKPAAPRFTGAAAVGGSLRGPGPISDDPGDEVFASTGDEGGFIIEPDAGAGNECDIFGDDCGPGEKCNAWASDGGSSWNATKCVPVDPDPDPIGAPCQTEGGGVSGLDSCVEGAMCWSVDDNGEGVCVEQCSCSADNPVCTTPNTTCTISNQGVLVLCLPVCDPLDADACERGEVCISNPSGGLFICVVDSSGAAGGAGDPCQFANSCDPGFLCAGNDGSCDGAGCCTPYCDLESPDCQAGFECAPFFPPGEAPKCFEDVGVCAPP